MKNNIVLIGIAGQWRIQDFPFGGVPSHWGGRRAVRGGTDLRHGCFLAKTYAKTKELDPVGGARAGSAPPGSANAGVIIHA